MADSLSVRFFINTDDQVEGSASLPEEGDDSFGQKGMFDPAPFVRNPKLLKPAAETGVVAAVEAEGNDNGDSQDASRTDDETHPTPMREKETAKVMDKPLTVLIVEDTLELAEVIQATLERMSLHVVHAAHGGKALQKFNELDPEIVLLDISLPDMTGWKIMDVLKLRYEQTSGRMPIIIIISAYDDPANRLVGKLQGVYSYLIKPFTADEIERTVRQAIDSIGSATP